MHSGTRNGVVQFLVCFVFTRLLLNGSFPGSRRTGGGMECGWVESQMFLLVQITADAIFGGLLVYIIKMYSKVSQNVSENVRRESKSPSRQTVILAYCPIIVVISYVHEKIFEESRHLNNVKLECVCVVGEERVLVEPCHFTVTGIQIVEKSGHLTSY